VREVGPHICIKRDLPGRLLGGRQSGRGDATGSERQEGPAVEHDTAPWIDFAIDSKATWISRGADGRCHITGGAALLPSGEDGSSCRRSGLPQHDVAGQCAGTSDLVGERDGGDLGRPPLFSKKNESRTLPACQTILNAIGNLLADGCQVEQFLFADIFRFFGKLPIYRRLVPEIIIPIHACHCA